MKTTFSALKTPNFLDEFRDFLDYIRYKPAKQRFSIFLIQFETTFLNR